MQMQGRDSSPAIGLMSGTSLDGVDAALLRTDGRAVLEFGESLSLPIAPELRERLRGLMRGEGDALSIEREVTLLHAQAVAALLEKAGLTAKDIAVIGFHGQTIAHRPREGITWQLGDGALLAERAGIDVVCDFRRADMAAGGQGAPLVPVFHAALAEGLPKPVAFLNLGGVGNVTWIDEDGELLAFDTGPGNAMLDDWCLRHTGEAFDRDGALSLRGTADAAKVQAFLRDAYFSAPAPKSLDRNHFSLAPFAELSPEDGAATLAECVAASVEAATASMECRPNRWYVCGGGRHNPAIMQALARRLRAVEKVEALGLDGDMLEAQAFAYLAVRAREGLPLSYPSTTGVTRAVTGGAFYRGGRGACC